MRLLMMMAASLLWLGSSGAQTPLCRTGLEPSLALVETGSSGYQLAEDVNIECSDGRTLTLLRIGERLPASYNDFFFIENEEADEVQLHFGASESPGGERRSLGLLVSDRLHKGPAGRPHIKATIRVDEKGLVTVTEWDPDEEVVIPIGTVRVEKAGAR